MPLNDSQLAVLVQLVLLQQQEILLLKAGTVALLEIAKEAGIADAETRFQAHSTALIQSSTSAGSR